MDMDLEAFRRETRAWLLANAPKSMFSPLGEGEDVCWGGRKAVYPNPEVRQWLDVMAARGWTAPAWPKEYGGGGLGKAEAKILAEEMEALHLRPPLFGFGLTMIGPVLLEMGSEDLKREHIPRSLSRNPTSDEACFDQVEACWLRSLRVRGGIHFNSCLLPWSHLQPGGGGRARPPRIFGTAMMEICRALLKYMLSRSMRIIALSPGPMRSADSW
jgi:hypothetical protein